MKINFISSTTPLDEAIGKLLQRRINMFTPVRQTSYIQSLCNGDKDKLQQELVKIDNAISEWQDKYYISECRYINYNMNNTEIEDACITDKLYNEEGKIELTADFLYGEIKKYGFINELHHTAIETACYFNDLIFLRSQWEDVVLEQIRSLRNIIKDMLDTCQPKIQNGQKKSNRSLKRIEDYPEVFDLDTCCSFTGYSKNSIYKLTAKNEIPFFRAGENGRKLIFKREEITEWILKRRQETKEEFIERMDGHLAARN